MDLLIEIGEGIWEGLTTPLYYFTDPTKRINIIYLVSSILLAYYVYYKAKTNLPFYKYLFSKEVWLSRSAFIDYKYFFFNGIIKIVLIAPILYSWRYLAVNTNDLLQESFGLTEVDLAIDNAVILYSLSIVIAYDLAFYLVHLAMHKIPFLWEFHKIHHSATSLNPITQYRLHPVELIINNLTYGMVSGTLLGVFYYFTTAPINFAVQANIFSMLFLFWGANLRHSHVKLKYFNFIERIFISPFQHQIHHSDDPKHYDKNMGAKLALWDWVFGTLVRSNESKKLSFGLGKADNINYNSFVKTLYMPFKNCGLYLIRLFQTKP